MYYIMKVVSEVERDIIVDEHQTQAYSSAKRVIIDKIWVEHADVLKTTYNHAGCGCCYNITSFYIREGK